MSEPLKIGEVLSETWSPCLHPQTEIRYKTIADGRKQLATQCLVCGVNTDGRWLPQTGIDMQKVRPWDDKLCGTYQLAQASVRKTHLRTERLNLVQVVR